MQETRRPYIVPITHDVPISLNGVSELDRKPPAGIGASGREKVGSDVVWGDFEVRFDRLLGRGGMGCVYLARQISLDRPVAVKVLETSGAPDVHLAEGFLQKFKVEIAALAKLNDPRIVSIIQAGENDGRCWFAMELLEGRTLEARVGDVELLRESEARRIGAELARALGAAWKAGIVHRDVKPANVFLLKDGGVKLADFGLARSPGLARTRLTDAGAFACTPAYASPEQIDGKATDHRSDIYSLGCVLYEMLTQRPPFVSESHLDALSKHLFQTPAPMRDLNPAISADFEEITARCLAKDPADRWEDYAELADALERPRPTPPPAPLRPEQPRRSRALSYAALTGLALFGWILTQVFGAEPAPEPQALVAPVELEPLQPPLPPATAVAPVPALAKPAPYRPTSEDLEGLERVLAKARATLAARSGYVFETPEVETGLTPWAAARAEAHADRVRRASTVFPPGPLFKPGEERTLMLRDGTSKRARILSETEAAVRLEGGLELQRAAIAPATFSAALDPRVRAAAGDAIGVLGDLAMLEETQAIGILDQAIEEALRFAEAGDPRALRNPRLVRAPRDPALEARWRMLEAERSAAEQLENGAIAALLLEKPRSRAAGRVSAAALQEFAGSLPAGAEHEVVGEIPWPTWEPDTLQAPGGSARFDGASMSYLLSARRSGEILWIKKAFEGAKKGYRVNFTFPEPGDGPTFALALSFSCWIEIGTRAASLKTATEQGPIKLIRSVDLGRRIEGGSVSVAPKDGLTLVWLEDRLLFSVPGSEWAHGAGMQIGVVGGSVRIGSIRVKDRTR